MLKSNSTIFITILKKIDNTVIFTGYTYIEESNQVVANCHKQMNSIFR